MSQIINYLFKSTLMIFILGGLLLVMGQLLGLLLGNPALIIGSHEWLANSTFIICAFAAVFGFLLQYISKT